MHPMQLARIAMYDMNDFQGMNKVYAERFQGHKPSRTTNLGQEEPVGCAGGN
jgi:hypothetical protein